MDFLDFRDFLFPASGFQSVQFRLIENKLGLLRNQRLNYNKAEYTAPLVAEHKTLVEESESQPSLFDLVERWLERTPFLESQGFQFWDEYQTCVKTLRDDDIRTTTENTSITDTQRAAMLQDIEHTWKLFQSLFNEEEHNRSIQQQKRRLSWRATKAALLITLYKEEPIFQVPFQILTVLQDIDELLTTWRTRHALMVTAPSSTTYPDLSSSDSV